VLELTGGRRRGASTPHFIYLDYLEGRIGEGKGGEDPHFITGAEFVVKSPLNHGSLYLYRNTVRIVLERSQMSYGRHPGIYGGDRDCRSATVRIIRILFRPIN